jgi:sporulation protein YlmC with PRC-barrel domain
MRISELYGARVVDGNGRDAGRVHDVRLATRNRSKATLEVTGLVVGPTGIRARAAHAWGYAEGRTQGPRLLARLTREAVQEARFVPASWVSSWTPPELTITGSADELESMTDRLRRE